MRQRFWMRIIIVVLLILVVGIMVIFILQPIQIALEDLSVAEKEQLLRLKIPGELAGKPQAELEAETVIPLRRIRGIPFLQIHINGQPYLLQLDFGSRYTFLSPDIALRLQLPLISEEFHERSPQGEFSFYLGHVREIKLGAARVRDDTVAIPLQRTAVKLFGLLRVFDYQGLVGAHSLQHFTVVLNLAKGHLTLRPKGEEAEISGGIVIPFKLVRGLVLLPVFLNGRGPFQLLLDPGAPGLVLTPQVAKQLGLGEQKRFNVDMQLGELLPLRLLAYVHELLEEARTDGVVLDGLLGRSFLERWQVTIDFERQLLYFEEP